MTDTKKELNIFDSQSAALSETFGVNVEIIDLFKYFDDFWKKYGNAVYPDSKRIGFGEIGIKWHELTLTLLLLLRQRGINPTKLDRKYLESFKETKPLKGMRGLIVGGFELEALAPIGLSVTSVDPRFKNKYILPDFPDLELQRIPEKLSDAPLTGEYDAIYSSRVFESFSGSDTMVEQQALFDLTMRLTKIEGFGVHLLENEKYLAFIEPRRAQREIELEFSNHKPIATSPSVEVLCAFRKLK